MSKYPIVIRQSLVYFILNLQNSLKFMLLGLKKLFSYYFVLRNTKNNNYLTVIKDNINR